ncbi:MarR family winged helix-turn-helix transcriptional regulator [Streptomyces coffeae]|uniref:MarR family transcriptional regulator n=1 Tax=Streptomyces coffeae TaxID=621382 RepID=A0ABS1NJQ4_9ACTN|nr:MarR family transcriptional regulator [Streptomyces coffeae]MBL1100322.1 MarR family transcriptional regulator [Streptomyces coffeae]
MEYTQQSDPGEPDAPAVREEVAEALEQLAFLAIRHLTNRDISFTAASTLGRLNREGPARLTALASDEGVTQPSMTQLVQRLERQGLVTRVADPADGRVVLVAVTDDGRALLAARRRSRTTQLTELLATLSPEDEEALATAVRAAGPAFQRLVESAARVRRSPGSTAS